MNLSKKKEKIRLRRFIEKYTNLESRDTEKKGKKHIRKPKMQARIKKTPKNRHR